MSRAKLEDEERFVEWLLRRVVREARGDGMDSLDVRPSGRLWMGRLAPIATAQEKRLGERGERLDPCEVGVRVRPSALDGREIVCAARFVVWTPAGRTGRRSTSWRKSPVMEVRATVACPTQVGDHATGGRREFEDVLRSRGLEGFSAEFRVEVESGRNGPEVVVTVVNTSQPDSEGEEDRNLYQVELEVEAGETVPFTMAPTPDSFRYDRWVEAYGINCGVERRGRSFVTLDFVQADVMRPSYWDASVGPKPDLRFERLAEDPLPELRRLVEALERWGREHWSDEALTRQASEYGWTAEMHEQARKEALQFHDELARVSRGLDLMESDSVLRRAFRLANRAFHRSVGIRHKEWRAFQVGFLLANAASLSQAAGDEADVVDTLWFPTGGGKTETYLLYAVTAAFRDRIRGKVEGITAWMRFPLRMLSLQQTQRFADVMAAAELVRLEEGLGGAPFSMGFLVGESSTPNRVLPRESAKLGELTPDDLDEEAATSRYRILTQCPFCGSDDLVVRFDEKRWTLAHYCRADSCPWQGRPLPFYIVDEEIFRYLPTVVVGTLDKGALLAVQASMRGLYGAPLGRCPQQHGFTYAPRRERPSGCLYPGCTAGQALPLQQDSGLYPPSVRLQDELHLLRDSLGAVDSHYEALLDHLQQSEATRRSKVLASSATLSGHERQVQALYRRSGRVFPMPGPRAGWSFWSQDSGSLARRYVGLSPRGVTLEYASDQIVETLQNAVRDALKDPARVAAEAGVDHAAIPELVLNYGVDVVYGSTLKDVEAAARSFEAQLRLQRFNHVTLTGRTPLHEVRQALSSLITPPEAFEERIHLIAASSMLSHGVDVETLNVMVMLGLPLSTAEFVQTTARVGRTHPGLVLVLHKAARERDAAIFRTFRQFVAHSDRLIEPVPITAKSRRVLELTFPGLLLGRIYGVHEPRAVAQGIGPLTTARKLREAFRRLRVQEGDELKALIQMLGFDEPLDANLREDLKVYVRDFFRNLADPAYLARQSQDLLPRRPMTSLRDVETQVPVMWREGRP